jgi:acyl carrier protein
LDSGFLDSLRGNSLDRVELVMAFEEAFETELSDQEIETIRSLRTVDEVLEYLRRRGKGGN